MSVDEYFTFKPDSYDEKDIYVCEHKYISSNINLQKIKNLLDEPGNDKKIVDEESKSMMTEDRVQVDSSSFVYPIGEDFESVPARDVLNSEVEPTYNAVKKEANESKQDENVSVESSDSLDYTAQSDSW